MSRNLLHIRLAAVVLAVIGVLYLHGQSGMGRGSSSTASSAPTAFASLTDGATVTWAAATNANDNKKLLFTTHGGNRTLNITGLTNGGSYVLELTQDGTGGEGLILGTGCTWKVGGGGVGAITLSSTASAIDVLAFSYDGANCLANFRTNFN